MMIVQENGVDDDYDDIDDDYSREQGIKDGCNDGYDGYNDDHDDIDDDYSREIGYT